MDFSKYRKPLGKLTLKNAIRSYKFASFIKCVPFELVSKDRIQVQEYGSRWRTWIWYLINLIFYSYGVFQIFSFSASFASKGLVTETALHIIYNVFYFHGMLYFTALLWKTPECVKFINEMDFLMRRSSESFQTPEYFSLAFIIMTVHYVILSLSCSVPFFLTVMHALNQNGAMYAFAYLPESWKAQVAWKLASVLMEFTILTWITVLITVVYVLWSGSVFQTILFLQEIKNQLGKPNINWRDVHRISVFYREIQVLNRLHNDLNASYFGPGFTAQMVVIAVVFLYSSLMTFHLLPLPVYLVFPLIGGFCIFLQTAFYLCICEWQIMSRQLKLDMFMRITQLQISTRNVQNSHDWKEMQKKVESFQNIDNHLAFFGKTAPALTQAVMEQIFSYILLLLSF